MSLSVFIFPVLGTEFIGFMKREEAGLYTCFMHVSAEALHTGVAIDMCVWALKTKDTDTHTHTHGANGQERGNPA